MRSPTGRPLANEGDFDVNSRLKQLEGTPRHCRREAMMLLRDSLSVWGDDSPPSRNTRSRKQRSRAVEPVTDQAVPERDAMKGAAVHSEAKSDRGIKTPNKKSASVDENFRSEKSQASRKRHEAPKAAKSRDTVPLPQLSDVKAEPKDEPVGRYTSGTKKNTIHPVLKSSAATSMTPPLSVNNRQRYRSNDSPELLPKHYRHNNNDSDMSGNWRPDFCVCNDTKHDEKVGPLESTVVSRSRPLLWTIRPVSPIRKSNSDLMSDESVLSGRSVSALLVNRSMQTSSNAAACHCDGDCDSLRKLIVTFVVLCVAVLSVGLVQLDPASRMEFAFSRWSMASNSFLSIIASLTSTDLVEDIVEGVAAFD